MHKLLFIRHGQSLANVNIRWLQVIPDPLIELTDIGVQQAHELGASLADGHHGINHSFHDTPFNIWTSPHVRATATANIINTHLNGEVVVHPLLYERSFGVLPMDEHVYHSQYRTAISQYELYSEANCDFFVRPIGGETYADVMVRLNLALQHIIKKDRKLGHDTSVIVTHKGVIRSALVLLSDVDCMQIEQVEVENCSVTSIWTDLYN